MNVKPTVHVLYYDGSFTLPEGFDNIPERRLASTDGDNLAEFSGRLCYDSLYSKFGRTTENYHAHIHETGHRSVYAHAVETFAIRYSRKDPWNALWYTQALAGRPGVWVTRIHEEGLKFCISLRAILEWDFQGADIACKVTEDYGCRANIENAREVIYAGVLEALKMRYPLSLKPCRPSLDGAKKTAIDVMFKSVPEYDTEKWVSLYITGVSRDLLQELVRHHYQANPSVRSTRYVDESKSNQIMHPSITEDLVDNVNTHFDTCKKMYKDVYTSLVGKGVDHKSARGAARGCLPGATETKLVYSLSYAQAKHFMTLRMNQETGAADPEIVYLSKGMYFELKNKLKWSFDR